MDLAFLNSPAFHNHATRTAHVLQGTYQGYPAGNGPSEWPSPKDAEVDEFGLALRIADLDEIVGDAGGADRLIDVQPEGAEAHSEASGRYQVEGLMPGPHQVYFHRPEDRGGRPAWRTFDLEVGQTTTLDLDDPE